VELAHLENVDVMRGDATKTRTGHTLLDLVAAGTSRDDREANRAATQMPPSSFRLPSSPAGLGPRTAAPGFLGVIDACLETAKGKNPSPFVGGRRAISPVCADEVSINLVEGPRKMNPLNEEDRT
jgi:hypothetical protein